MFIKDDIFLAGCTFINKRYHYTVVRNKIRYDRQLIVRKVAIEDSIISIRSCHLILSNELGMKRVSAKCIAKLLTDEEMEHCIIYVCLKLKNWVSKDSIFLKSIITGDETWV